MSVVAEMRPDLAALVERAVDVDICRTRPGPANYHRRRGADGQVLFANVDSSLRPPALGQIRSCADTYQNGRWFNERGE